MKMKSYIVTIEANVTVQSYSKRGAVDIARRAAAACPELLTCSYIGDSYRTPFNLDEEKVSPPFAEKLSQGPSEDDGEVPF